MISLLKEWKEIENEEDVCFFLWPINPRVSFSLHPVKGYFSLGSGIKLGQQVIEKFSGTQIGH